MLLINNLFSNLGINVTWRSMEYNSILPASTSHYKNILSLQTTKDLVIPQRLPYYFWGYWELPNNRVDNANGATRRNPGLVGGSISTQSSNPALRGVTEVLGGPPLLTPSRVTPARATPLSSGLFFRFAFCCRVTPGRVVRDCETILGLQN